MGQVFCLAGLVAWCYAKNISRILAPKLKKRESDGEAAGWNMTGIAPQSSSAQNP